jgi:membrane protein implicated in regulation of membrane protease activity
VTLAGIATVHLPPVVFAHLGHWYIQLLFVAPVAILVGVLSFQGWRENRAREKEERRRPPVPRR